MKMVQPLEYHLLLRSFPDIRPLADSPLAGVFSDICFVRGNNIWPLFGSLYKRPQINQTIKFFLKFSALGALTRCHPTAL